MRHKLKLWGSDFLDSKYLHIRCVALVVNLVVNDGLRECSISIERVRETVKWVKSSPARLVKFKSCIVFEGIESKKLVCLDVSTRWNSTYLMLEVAEKYEAAFKLLEGNDKNFKWSFGCSDIDIDNCRYHDIQDIIVFSVLNIMISGVKSDINITQQIFMWGGEYLQSDIDIHSFWTILSSPNLPNYNVINPITPNLFFLILLLSRVHVLLYLY
ncbi:Zinc finger BED domain-containing protein RICESLEEPER 2 [Linum perenne]